MKIGFIGLGNVGGELASSLLRNNFDLTVRDLNERLTDRFKDLGAKVAKSQNMEVGINVEGGILWKKLTYNSNKRGVKGGKNLRNQ